MGGGGRGEDVRLLHVTFPLTLDYKIVFDETRIKGVCCVPRPPPRAFFFFLPDKLRSQYLQVFHQLPFQSLFRQLHALTVVEEVVQVLILKKTHHLHMHPTVLRTEMRR